jgi:hypothetical protein
MQLQLDHVVYYIERTPEEAVKQMAEMGLHAVTGGRHINWGTYNALCYFDLSYIEFLGIENLETATHAVENPLIEQLLYDRDNGEGFVQICLRTNNITYLSEHFVQKGMKPKLLDGSRTRADGSVIRWKMLFLESDFTNLPFPFFIQWEQSDEERRRDLQERNLISYHPIGDIRIKEIAIAVKQLDRTISLWEELFALEKEEPFKNNDLQAYCQRLKLSGGDLLFCQPIKEGPAQCALSSKGERPFRMYLEGTTISIAL